MRRARRAALAGVLLIAVASLASRGQAPRNEPAVLGAAPGYGPAALSVPPNVQAVASRIWVPGLDEGDTPQGLAAIDADTLVVSAYRSTSLRVGRGPCRIYRVIAATGAVTGRRELPPPCGHAGGAAVLDGTLFVADTHTLFALPLDGAFASGPVRAHPLGRGLVGALATAAGGALWIGTYRTDGPGVLSRFDAALLRGLADGRTLDAAMASATLPLPSYAQGAAFDPDGRRVWVSRSTLRWGALDEVSAQDGHPIRSHPAPAGLEGVSFAGPNLWAASEAGARHYYEMPASSLVWPFHPVLFALDPARLDRSISR